MAIVGKNATHRAPEFNKVPNRATPLEILDVEFKGLIEGHPPSPEPDFRVYWNW